MFSERQQGEVISLQWWERFLRVFSKHVLQECHRGGDLQKYVVCLANVSGSVLEDLGRVFCKSATQKCFGRVSSKSVFQDCFASASCKRVLTVYKCRLSKSVLEEFQ